MRTDNLRLAKVSKRLTAFLLVLCFLVSDIFPSSYKYVYAQSLVGGVEGQDSHSLNANRITPENMANLTLPLELGMIESVHPAANGNNRWVFLLQDAHSIPEAQISLQNLVQYFQKNYGVNLVALEGASGKLDTTLFRAFPDPEKLASVFAQYLNQGELSGAAVSSVLSPYASEYYGVENTALYEKAIEAYLKSLPLRPIMKERVEKLGADLELLKKQHYSPELKSFDEKQNAFEENEDSLTAFLTVLAGYVPANEDKLPAFQKTYPHLAVILEEVSQDESRKELLIEEARRAGNQISLALDREDKKNFESKKHAFQSGEMPVEVYLGEMMDFSSQKNITIDFSDAAERQAKRYNAMRNMRGGELFDEIRAFSARIASHLAKTDETRSLIKLSEEARLLDRLTLTKLTRNDWNSLNAQKQNGNYPDALREVSANIARLKQELISDYPAYKFYQISCERDAAITHNLFRLMEKNKNQSALLVTGGFHAGALGKMLAAKNISYAVVLPKLTDIPAQSIYENHMKGKVSWQKFLKAKNGRVDVFDAFTRAASEQLLADSVERVADRKDFSSTLFAKRYTLKHWRDQLIRDLAKERRLSETYRYSSALDRLTWEGMNASERQHIEKQWNQKLDELVSKLETHKNEKNWSGAKVMDLMGKTTATPWTAIPFARASYPGDFLTVGDVSRAEVRMGWPVSLKYSSVDDPVKNTVETFYAETYNHYDRLSSLKRDEALNGKGKETLTDDEVRKYQQWMEIFVYWKSSLHAIDETRRVVERYNAQSEELFSKIKRLPPSAFDYIRPKNEVTRLSLMNRSKEINRRAGLLQEKVEEIQSLAGRISQDLFPYNNPNLWTVRNHKDYGNYLSRYNALLDNTVQAHAGMLQLLTELQTVENDFNASPLSKRSEVRMIMHEFKIRNPIDLEKAIDRAATLSVLIKFPPTEKTKKKAPKKKPAAKEVSMEKELASLNQKIENALPNFRGNSYLADVLRNLERKAVEDPYEIKRNYYAEIITLLSSGITVEENGKYDVRVKIPRIEAIVVSRKPEAHAEEELFNALIQLKSEGKIEFLMPVQLRQGYLIFGARDFEAEGSFGLGEDLRRLLSVAIRPTGRLKALPNLNRQEIQTVVSDNFKKAHPGIWNQIEEMGLDLAYAQLTRIVNEWRERDTVPGKKEFTWQVLEIVAESNRDYSSTGDNFNFISIPLSDILYEQYFNPTRSGQKPMVFAPRSESRSAVNRAGIKILMALKSVENRVLYRALVEMGYNKSNIQLEPRLEGALEAFNDHGSEFDLVILPFAPREDDEREFSRKIDEAWLGMSDTERPLLLRINTRENADKKAMQLTSFQLKRASEKPLTGGFGNRPIPEVWESFVEARLPQEKSPAPKEAEPRALHLPTAIHQITEYLKTIKSDEASAALANLNEWLALMKSDKSIDEDFKDLIVETVIDQREALMKPLVARANAESDKPWAQNGNQVVSYLNAAFDSIHDTLFPTFDTQSRQGQNTLSERILEAVREIHLSLTNYQEGFNDDLAELFSALETIMGLETKDHMPELGRQATIWRSGILNHKETLKSEAKDGLLAAHADAVRRLLQSLDRVEPRSEVRQRRHEFDHSKRKDVWVMMVGDDPEYQAYKDALMWLGYEPDYIQIIPDYSSAQNALKQLAGAVHLLILPKTPKQNEAVAFKNLHFFLNQIQTSDADNTLVMSYAKTRRKTVFELTAAGKEKSFEFSNSEPLNMLFMDHIEPHLAAFFREFRVKKPVEEEVVRGAIEELLEIIPQKGYPTVRAILVRVLQFVDSSESLPLAWKQRLKIEVLDKKTVLRRPLEKELKEALVGKGPIQEQINRFNDSIETLEDAFGEESTGTVEGLGETLEIFYEQASQLTEALALYDGNRFEEDLASAEKELDYLDYVAEHEEDYDALLHVARLSTLSQYKAILDKATRPGEILAARRDTYQQLFSAYNRITQHVRSEARSTGEEEIKIIGGKMDQFRERAVNADAEWEKLLSDTREYLDQLNQLLKTRKNTLNAKQISALEQFLDQLSDLRREIKRRYQLPEAGDEDGLYAYLDKLKDEVMPYVIQANWAETRRLLSPLKKLTIIEDEKNANILNNFNMLRLMDFIALVHSFIEKSGGSEEEYFEILTLSEELKKSAKKLPEEVQAMIYGYEGLGMLFGLIIGKAAAAVANPAISNPRIPEGHRWGLLTMLEVYETKKPQTEKKDSAVIEAATRAMAYWFLMMRSPEGSFLTMWESSRWASMLLNQMHFFTREGVPAENIPTEPFFALAQKYARQAGAVPAKLIEGINNKSTRAFLNLAVVSSFAMSLAAKEAGLPETENMFKTFGMSLLMGLSLTSTSTASSLWLPAAIVPKPEGRRSEARESNVGKSLLMGVHDFEPDAAYPNDVKKRHYFPDWWVIRLLGQALYDAQASRPGPVTLQDISQKVRSQIKGHEFDGGRYTDEQLEKLLRRMVDEYGLLKASANRYEIAVDPKAFLIRTSHFKTIRNELKNLLTALNQKQQGAEKNLQDYLKDFSAAARLWPKYPVESAWPFLRAISTLKPGEKEALIKFLESPKQNSLRKEPLVDSLHYILSEKISPSWLQDFAASIKGSTLYYISPETWLAAGGLGRVGQYHTLAAKLLMGNQASLVTIEPYYANRIVLSQDEKGETQEKLVKDIDYSKLPVPVENLEVWKTFEVVVNKQGRRTPVQVEILKGKNPLGVEVFLYRDKPEREGEEPYFTKLLYSYGQHGNAKVEEFTEFASKVSLKLSKKIEHEKSVKGESKNTSTLWANDGQTALLPLFKLISDDLEMMPEEERERIKTDPTHEYYDYRDLIQDADEVSLTEASVLQTTHTYRNRVIQGPEQLIQGLRLPSRYHGYLHSGEWIYLKDGNYQNAYDATSAGVRGAWSDLGGANGVAAIHAEEMNPLDEGVELNGITNGDDRKATRKEFEAAFHELYPEGDPENPEVNELVETKKLSKKKLSQNKKLNELDPLFALIDPEKMLISYSGRMVDEKIGDMRAFTAENIEALVRAGAQIILMGNVQSGNKASKEIYLKLKKIEAKLAEEKRQAALAGNKQFGLFIVASGWSIPEQRFLLAATDLQVNDSDRDPKRGTEAAGLTETDAPATGGLEMSSPFLEAIFHQQGEVLDWSNPESGNTIIPESDKPADYQKAMLKALKEYQYNRLRFAEFQKTSLEFSKNLAAVPTAMNYLRLIDKIRTTKKNKEGLWARFFEGLRKPNLQSVTWFQDSQARLFLRLWNKFAVVSPNERKKIFDESYTREDAEKIFNINAPRFGWWKNTQESLVSSDPGLGGLIETFRRLMRNQPQDLWASLEHHAKHNDLFNYLNYVMGAYSNKTQPLLRRIRKLEKEAFLSENIDFKIQKNIEALGLVESYLEGLAGFSLNQYLDMSGKFLYKNGKAQPLGALYENLFSNTLFSKVAARYLDANPDQAEKLQTTEKGLRAYWIQTDKKNPRILMLNTGAIEYPDSKEPSVKKAWGKIVFKGAFQSWAESQIKSENQAIQVYDVKKNAEYGLYWREELSGGLKTGVPGIQVIGLRIKKSEALDIRKKELVHHEYQHALELWKLLRDSGLNAENMKTFLTPDPAIAAKKYSKERIPALMALVAVFAPQHFKRIAKWNPEVYAKLTDILLKEDKVFSEGKTTLLSSGRGGTIVFSKSLKVAGETRNIVFAVELDRSFVSNLDQKSWVVVRDPGTDKLENPMGLEAESIYEIHDLIRGGMNNTRNGLNLMRHWDVGIPLNDISYKGKMVQKGWGFDVYRLTKVKNLKVEKISSKIEKKQEPQELIVHEINTRAYFIENKFKSFDDLTLEKLKAIKDSGKNTLWLMGVYQESPFSKEFNRYWGERNNAPGGQQSSAFALLDYTVNPDFGGREAFERLSARAKKADLRLMLDYIPNHFALDSPLIQEHPDWFIHRTIPPGDADYEDLFKNPTGYFPVELKDGRTIWVARATDGLSGPWGDTAQLNYLNPEVWKMMAERLLELARLTNGGGVRIDSLQILKPDVYRRLWIPYMQPADFENHIQAISKQVFGREPHDRDNIFGSMFAWIKEQYPDFKMIGEIYHGQEGYWQQAGVDLTYAKYVYDWLVDPRDGQDGWQLFKNYTLRKWPHENLGLDYLFHSTYFLENHDERIRVLQKLGQRLGKNPADPEVVAWSKLLATAISTIPGSPLFYDGQEKGHSRRSSSANSVPSNEILQMEPETIIRGLESFYKELLVKANHPVFRLGGFPEEIPHQGGNGGLLAFVRRHEGDAGIAVFNHSRETVTVALDLSLIGYGQRLIVLEPWGTHLEVVKIQTFRSEARVSEKVWANEKALFQKGGYEGWLERQKDKSSYRTPIGENILEDYIEGFRLMIQDIEDPAIKAIAQNVRDHFVSMIRKKKVFAFTGLFFKDGYYLGSFSADEISFAHLFVKADPVNAVTVSAQAIFRLAALSWIKKQNMNEERANQTLSQLIPAMFTPAEIVTFKNEQEKIAKLERWEDFEESVFNFPFFGPGEHYESTETLFFEWLRHDRKGEVFPPLESAAFLMVKVRKEIEAYLQENLERTSRTSVRVMTQSAAQREKIDWLNNAFHHLALQVVAFSFYRNVYFSWLNRIVEARYSFVDEVAKVSIKWIMENKPETADEAKVGLSEVFEQNTDLFANNFVPLTAVFGRAFANYFNQKNKPLNKTEIINEVLKDPKVLSMFTYPALNVWVQNMNMPIPPSHETYQSAAKLLATSYDQFLQLPVDLKDPAYAWLDQAINLYASEPGMGKTPLSILVPGSDNKVSLESLQRWMVLFSRIYTQDRTTKQIARASHFSEIPAFTFPGSSHVSRTAELDSENPNGIRILDLSSTPIGELASPLKMPYYHRSTHEVLIQRYEQNFWADIYNWIADDAAPFLSSTNNESAERFIRTLVHARLFQEPATLSVGNFSPQGVNLKPWVTRLMDLSAQMDLRYWDMLKRYYERVAEANSEEEPWLELFTHDSFESHLWVWYYSITTGKKGMLPWLASRLKTSSGRLTKEETKDVLDVIYSLWWSGPMRIDRARGVMPLLERFLEYITFYPDGIEIKNMEYFKDDFLRQFERFDSEDMGESFEDWKRKFEDEYGDIGRLAEMNSRGTPAQELVFQATLEPLMVSSGSAQIRWKEDPAEFFSPENIPVENLVFSSKWPAWKGVKPQQRFALVNAPYEKGGVSIPGTSFRYVFKGPKENGIVQLMVVTVVSGDDKKYEQLVITLPKNDALSYVQVPLSEAGLPYGDKGGTESVRHGVTTSWHKVPDLAKIQVKPLTAKDHLFGKDGFYQLPVKSELLKLKITEQKEKLVFIPETVRKEALLLQVYRNQLFFYSADAQEFLGSAIITGNAELRFQDAGPGFKVLENLPDLLKDFEPHSMEHYYGARKVAETLASLFNEGKGYDAIQFRKDASEPSFDGKTLVLPEQTPHLVSKDEKVLQKIYASVKAVLESQDPLYKMRALKESLENSWSFESGLHLLEEKIPEVFQVEIDSTWDLKKAELFYSYSDIAKEIISKIETARWIVSFYRASNKDNNRVINQLITPNLKQLIDKPIPPSGFILKNSKGGYVGYNVFYKEAARVADGIGYLTSRHFRSTDGKFEFKPESGDNGTAYLFILVNGKLRIFDLDSQNELNPQDETILKLQEEKAAFLNRPEFSKFDQVNRKTISDLLSHALRSIPGKAEELGKQQREGLAALEFIPLMVNMGDFYAQLNLALIRLVFAKLDASEASPAAFKALASQFKQVPGALGDQILNLSALSEGFGFSPMMRSQQEQELEAGRAAEYEIFLREVLLPAAVDPNLGMGFGTHDYFLQLLNHLQNIRTQVATVLKQNPEAAAADGTRWLDTQAALQHSLIPSNENPYTSPVQKYFILKELEAVRVAREEKQKAEEAARQQRVDMTKRERQKETPYLAFLGGAPQKERPQGGRQETLPGIGGSSTVFDYQDMRLIIDAGQYLDAANTLPDFSKLLDQETGKVAKMPKAIFLTHVHNDHMAGLISLLQFLWKNKKSPEDSLPFVYVVKGSKPLLIQALKDSAADMAAREQARVNFTAEQVQFFEPFILEMDENAWYQVDSPSGASVKVRMRPAGHLLGAQSIDIATPESRTLLTGDISKHNQGAFVPGVADWSGEEGPAPHNVLGESTYGAGERSNEEEEEKRLILETVQTLKDGGKVLMGAFANGRSQRALDVLIKYFFRSEELLSASEKQAVTEIRSEILNKIDWHATSWGSFTGFLRAINIVIDGRAVTYTEIYRQKYPHYLTDEHIHYIDQSASRDKKRAQRESFLNSNQPLIVIASSGNYSYGTSRWWAEKMVGPDVEQMKRLDLESAKGEAEQLRKSYRKNRIYVLGYAEEGEASSRLRKAKPGDAFAFNLAPETKPRTFEVVAGIAKYGLAGHISGEENMEFLSGMRRHGGLQKLFLSHGDRRSIEELSRTIRTRPEFKGVEVVQARAGVTGLALKAAFNLTRSEREAYQEWHKSVTAEPLPLANQIDQAGLMEKIRLNAYRPPTPVRTTFREEAPVTPQTVAATAVPDALPPEAVSEIPTPAAVTETISAPAAVTETVPETTPVDVTVTTRTAKKVFKSKAEEEVITGLRQSGSLTNLLQRKTSDGLSKNALNWLQKQIGNDVKTIVDPENKREYQITTNAKTLIQSKILGVAIHDPAEGKPAPKSKQTRSEVRAENAADLKSQTRNFLTRFALREGRLFLQDAARLSQALLDFGVEEAAYAMREEGAKPLYPQIFSGASVYADYRTEAGFLNAHPDYSAKLAARIDLTIEKIRAGSHAYLQTDANNKLSFAYAYHTGGNASAVLRSNIISNIRLVKALKEEYPSRVKGNIRILMPSFLSGSESFAPFIKEIESSGVAKVLWMDQAGASNELERYLVENPNALVYGRFDSYLVSGKMAYRYMDSKVSLEAAFPVTLTVTAGLAATPKIEAAELRKTLPDLLPGVIRFNGASFEITSAALELVYHEHQVAQLLARMA